MIVGIDPGLSGGIGFLADDGTLIGVEAMPTEHLAVGGRARNRVAAYGLHQLLGRYAAVHGLPRALYQEQPSTMKIFNPQTGKRDIDKGAVGLLATGRGVGLPEMWCAVYGVPYQDVPANLWKGKLNCPSDKAVSRALATKYFPNFAHVFQMKTKDGQAEAALIGLYGLRFGLLGREAA